MAAVKKQNRGVVDDRLTGYGIIQPGAGANRESESRMTKVERDYVKGTGRRNSAYDAVRRARRANKKPSL